MNSRETLGSFCRELRKRAELTQEALAKRAEVSVQTIFNIENDNDVRPETLGKIYNETLKCADAEYWRIAGLYASKAFGLAEVDAVLHHLASARAAEAS